MVTLPSNSIDEPMEVDLVKNTEASISPMVFENIKIFTSQEQRFDSLRTAIYGKLSQLSKKIILNTKEWQDMDLKARCVLIAEIQECFYDLQLVEHASQMPVLALAKAVFSLNKKRCVHKAPSAKVKPSKKQKFGNILTRDIRRNDNERKSPSVLKSTSNEDFHNSRDHDESCSADQSTSTKKSNSTKRRSNRNDKSSHRIENGDDRSARNNDSHKNGGDVVDDGDHIENGAENSEKHDKKDFKEIHDDQSNSFIDLAPPRRRAAALAAAVSVAETVNPHRSASPKKRTANNQPSSSNHADDEGSTSSVQDVNPDEPTYCLCEQVSFGDMICCDYAKCPIEWFHFSCVNIKIKPKGKKWFCPLCRGDKPTVLKASLQSKR